MPTRILLLRHAAHDRVDRVLCGRMGGVTLGEAGLTQADWLACEMTHARPTALHTSPLERCRQTARAIARRLDMKPLVSDAITEIDFGAWTGRPFSVLQDDPDWQRWNADRDNAAAPRGECMRAVQRRAVDHVEHAAAVHQGETVALVSHGDVIKAILSHYLDLPLQAYWRFDIAPASISEIEVCPGYGRVLGINRAPGA